MRCCHSTYSLLFRVLRGSPGGGGSAAVCDPNPLRPFVRKIPAPIKIKSALPPPPKTQIPPPQNEEFMDMAVFLQKEGIFPGVHKIGAAIYSRRIADKNSRIFPNLLSLEFVKLTFFSLCSYQELGGRTAIPKVMNNGPQSAQRWQLIGDQ